MYRFIFQVGEGTKKNKSSRLGVSQIAFKKPSKTGLWQVGENKKHWGIIPSVKITHLLSLKSYQMKEKNQLYFPVHPKDNQALFLQNF